MQAVAALRLEHIQNRDIGDPIPPAKQDKWQKAKRKQFLLYKAYKVLGNDIQAQRVKNCGKRLEFDVHKSGKRDLTFANFCMDPMCPVCAWRKSMKRIIELEKVVDELKNQGFKYFLHIDLTLKNTFEIEGSLNRLWDSWRKFSRRKWFKELFAGYSCNVEYTYSEKEGYHPHMHVIVVFKKGVMEKTCKGKLPMPKTCLFALSDYMSAEWLDITGDSFIVGLKGAKNLYQACKYVLKEKDFFKGDFMTDKLVEVIGEIKGRKLCYTAGVFAKVRRELLDKQSDEKVASDDKEADPVVGTETWLWDIPDQEYKIKFTPIEKPRKIEVFTNGVLFNIKKEAY